MLKSEHRLPKGVRLASPKVFKTDHFFVKAAKNNIGSCRIVISISKKIDKRAVVRNKIKRKIANCLEGKVKSMPGVDILFILKHKIKEIDSAIICQEIEKILVNLQIAPQQQRD